MQRLFIFACCLASLAFLDRQAEACKCKPSPPPKEAMAAAAAVFTGKCVNIVEDEKAHEKTVTFEVDRVWKGDIRARVVVKTSIDGASCGYGFTTKGDATYIIYAYSEEGNLHTGLCTRTRTLANAKEDLKDLGDGEKPKEVKPAK